MPDKEKNTGFTPQEKKRFIEFLEKASNQKKQTLRQPLLVWAFVIGLNVAGLLGAIYLQSRGIDVFSLQGGS